MRSLLLLHCRRAAGRRRAGEEAATPNDIVAAAPASAWKTIAPTTCWSSISSRRAGGGPARAAHSRRCTSPTSRRWPAANIGTARPIYRVQDNYVAQWGLNESDKPWPAGVTAKPPAEYTRPLKGLTVKPLGFADPYAPGAGFVDGWPVAYHPRQAGPTSPIATAASGSAATCRPTPGPAASFMRSSAMRRAISTATSPSSAGSIDGIDKLSSLPRGTEALGFYKDKSAVRADRQRSGSRATMPAAERPSYEYLDTGSASFAAYLRVRANRNDDFYIRPAGGVDLCNVKVPVRKKA